MHADKEHAIALVVGDRLKPPGCPAFGGAVGEGEGFQQLYCAAAVGYPVNVAVKRYIDQVRPGPLRGCEDRILVHIEDLLALSSIRRRTVRFEHIGGESPITANHGE